MTGITSMTNWEKVVGWDADFYKAIPDEDCIVCLTEKQVYLLAQTLDQLTWDRTRWQGDKTGLDFDAIASEVQYALRERMTCEKLTEIQNQLTQLSDMVNYLFNETQINEGDTPFSIDGTTVNDGTTSQQLSDFGVSATTCDDAGKDAIYSAVSKVVRYIVQNNTDFLENFSQAFGTADNAANLLSATPVVGLLPVDEMFAYAAFIGDELLGEYNATVDETLIQNTICDLYCIAVANGCTLDFNDVYSYFADKVAPTFNNAVSTFLNLVQFAATGTFTGDDYFYFMCYFQLVTVGMGEFFLRINSVQPYALKAREGLASPSHDWSIYCTSCPVFTHWSLEWDFAWGAGDFVIVTGTQQGNGIKAVTGGGTWYYEVKLNLDQQYSIENLAAIVSNDGRIGNGSDDFERYSGFPNLDYGGAEAVFLAAGFLLPATNQVVCNAADVTNNSLRSIAIRGSMTAGANKNLTMHKVRIVGDNIGTGKPVLAKWFTAEPTCAEFE